MCLHPRLLKNVNHVNRMFGYTCLKVNTSFIAVPCGTCPACLALKQAFIIQRCQLEAIDHDIWFCTLTYNNDSLPVMNVNGRKIRYACKSDFQNWIKMLRKYNVFGSDFRYLAVSERGKERHRPHWHIMFFTPKIENETYAEKLDRERFYWRKLLFYWRRNYGSTRVPLWKDLLTYRCIGRKRNYDFHYVNPCSTQNGEDDVAFYVSKYVLKIDEYTKNLKSGLYFNLPEEEFKEVWSEVKNHFMLSKGFGDIKNPKVIDYVRKCISSSVRDESKLYPVFINRITGQEFPLSPYLRRKFVTIEDGYVFYERSGALNYSGDIELLPSEYQLKKEKFDKMIKAVSQRDCDDMLGDDVIDTYISPTIQIRFIVPWLDFTENDEFKDF